MRTYKLYQLKRDDSNHYHRFVGLEMLKEDGLKVEFNRYNKMYEGILFPGETLETLYRKFNMDHPDDFKGWSMSVSDVVVITEDGKAKAFYCDSYGFTEVPEFLKGKKKAEGAMLYQLIIDTNGNPSVRQLKEIGYPEGTAVEMLMRMSNVNRKSLVASAKSLLEKE